MGSATDHPASRGFHEPDRKPRSILELVAGGELDTGLAALLWLLLEARVPVVVAAAPPLAGKTTLLTALLDFLPADTRRVVLRGVAEDFAWLPEADSLGWHPNVDADASADTDAARWLRASGMLPAEPPPVDIGPADPATTYLLVAEISPHLAVHAWGSVARTAIRAVGLGYGLGATLHADSLEGVFALLRDPGLGLGDDEIARLGVVLILRAWPVGDGVRRRVAAAHYLRPPMRDAGGHVQRLAPAVLATWDERTDAFEHFAWGVTQELAGRVGRRPDEFEREHDRRARYLDGLVAAALTGLDETRAAIAAYHSAGYHRWC